MSAAIDLNADLGEGAPFDADLMRIVSSASIACGGHAGDANTIYETMLLAKANHVRIGAHPSYADRANFGRLKILQPHDVTVADVLTQLEVFAAVAQEAGVQVAYVKPHGALYNETAKDAGLCLALYSAIRARPGIGAVMGLPATQHELAARETGLTFISEAFADRAYEENGTLAPRSERGAVHEDIPAIVAQATEIARHGAVTARTGSNIPLSARSICLHGDSEHALAAARAIRAAFEAEDIEIRA
ncbi:MAG: LamB/YcsF family protein [Hyphomicrobiaceae bacterium]|nr:LamB/YcsF family protein [Hyphomicrobiaceae bacterium]